MSVKQVQNDFFFQKKCQKTNPQAKNCSSEEMTEDNEDIGSELEDNNDP